MANCTQNFDTFDSARLTHEDIEQITLNEPNPEEQRMLDSLENIHCLTHEKESLALFRLCKLLPEGSKILEVGSYQGASAVAMGHAIAGRNCELYCLDPWSNFLEQDDFVDFDRSQISDDCRVINNFINNTKFIGENLRMLRGKSSSFAGLLGGKDFDFIFIDGAHDYDSVRTDIKIAFSALKPGGILCGHDFHNAGHGVVRAVNELIAVPSISIKGVIKYTYIWFAVVDAPRYQYLMTDVSDLCNRGLLKEAFDKALKVHAEYKNDEVLEFILAIKTAMASSGAAV